MSAGHTATVKLAQIEATRKGWRLAVNTIFEGWVGEVEKTWRASLGWLCVELKRARWMKFGLGTGTLDLVGWIPREIRASDIPPGGVLHIAQYAEIDAKTQGYKRMSDAQRNRVSAIRAAGGFAGVAIKVTDAEGRARASIAEIGEE